MSKTTKITIATSWTLLCAALCGIGIWLAGSGESQPSATAVTKRSLRGQAPLLTTSFCWPRPAFTSPPLPPPCADPLVPRVAPPPQQPRLPLPQPPRNVLMLELAPSRIVSPVRGEVVLVAGLRDQRGRYVSREAVEWILAEGGVGHFIDVGDDQGLLKILNHHKGVPGKKTATYAVSRTLPAGQIVTRGTSNPTDDVVVRQGQTWVSVTSPVEGTSYVTVFAPNADGWDQRRQTALIHWVDAQWAFPPPVVVQAGGRHILTTTVTRTSGAPAEGYIVRYEITSGATAELAAVEEIKVDDQGRASVEIAQRTGALAGVTRVHCQVIRPGGGDLPRTVIGQGETTVQWSAAQLAVSHTAPARVRSGQPATIQIQVANVGDLAARGVVLAVDVPATVQVRNASPPPQPMGNRLEWRFETLAPQARAVVELSCDAKDGQVRFQVQAAGADGLQGNDAIDIDFFQPSLQVEIGGPDQATVGDEITFPIRVTNVGQQPLFDVIVSDTFDRGFEHLSDQGPARNNRLERNIGQLAPGANSDFAVTLKAQATGRLCHRIEATASGNHVAQLTKCVDIAAPLARPEVQVQIIGHTDQQVGRDANYDIEVTNQGNVPLTNVLVEAAFRDSLYPDRASQGFQVDRSKNRMVWSLPTLQVGEKRTFQVNCKCVKADDNGGVLVTVANAQNAGRQEEFRTKIQPAPAPPAAQPGVGPPNTTPSPLGAGPAPLGSTSGSGLNVDVDIREARESQGKQARVSVRIANRGNESDRDVILSLELSDGLEFISHSGPVGVKDKDPRNPRFQPVRFFRANDPALVFDIDIAVQAAGRHQVLARVESDRTPTPIEIRREYIAR